MINDILDISKIESKTIKLNLMEIRTDIVIKEVVEILSPLTDKKSISLTFENTFEGKLRADYQKFRQILYNLLSNAIKFTQEGGKIIIRTYEKDGKFYLEVEDVSHLILWLGKDLGL